MLDLAVIGTVPVTLLWDKHLKEISKANSKFKAKIFEGSRGTFRMNIPLLPYRFAVSGHLQHLLLFYELCHVGAEAVHK